MTSARKRITSNMYQTSSARMHEIAVYAENYGIEVAMQDYNITKATVKDYMERDATDKRTKSEYQDCLGRLVPRRWNTAPKFEGDWMIFADGHCPFIHWPTLEKMVETAKRLKIKKLLLPGDWFDFEDLSKFDFGGDQVDTADELLVGRDLLHRLTKDFDEIHLTRGNHEERLIKFLKRVKRLMMSNDDLRKYERIVRAEKMQTADSAWHEYKAFLTSDKVFIYNDAWCTINGKFRITHPSTMTNIPPNSEERLAYKHGMHIVGTHVHNFGIRVCMDGQKLAVRLGCGCDPEKIFYYNKRDTSNYKWVNGFAWVKNGKLGTWIDHPDLFQMEDYYAK